MVGKLKGKSSYVVRKEFWSMVKKKLWDSNFWNPSYCVVSCCGGAPLEIFKEYVQNQRTPPSITQIERSKRFTGKHRVDGRWEPTKKGRTLNSQLKLARLQRQIAQENSIKAPCRCLQFHL